MVEEYAQNKIKTVCVAGMHNEEIHENKYLAILHSFAREETEQVVAKLFGKRNWECILTELDSQLFLIEFQESPTLSSENFIRSFYIQRISQIKSKA